LKSCPTAKSPIEHGLTIAAKHRLVNRGAIPLRRRVWPRRGSTLSPMRLPKRSSALLVSSLVRRRLTSPKKLSADFLYRRAYFCPQGLNHSLSAFYSDAMVLVPLIARNLRFMDLKALGQFALADALVLYAMRKNHESNE